MQPLYAAALAAAGFVTACAGADDGDRPAQLGDCVGTHCDVGVPGTYAPEVAIRSAPGPSVPSEAPGDTPGTRPGPADRADGVDDLLVGPGTFPVTGSGYASTGVGTGTGSGTGSGTGFGATGEGRYGFIPEPVAGAGVARGGPEITPAPPGGVMVGAGTREPRIDPGSEVFNPPGPSCPIARPTVGVVCDPVANSYPCTYGSIVCFCTSSWLCQ